MADPQLPSLKWSAQYTVRNTSRSERLPGDKILLPQSALEALLSASSTAAVENARQDLPQFDPYNSASFAAYRQAESQFQDRRQQLPYPLTFRLVNPDNDRVVYAGIREFSAEEGDCEISPFLREALGIEAQDGKANESAMNMDVEVPNIVNHSAITVHAKQLPKGTFVKLRPLEAGYDPEDWKALLERHLRHNYTTLTNGEVLVVQGGASNNSKKEEYRFLVDGFKPEGVDGICVVDTDLEVDIEALNEEQARETLRQVAAKSQRAPGTEQGSSPGGELDLFRLQEGQVRRGEYVDYEVKSWDRSQPLEFELSGDAEDVEDLDLLVNPFSATQRAKPRIDEHVFADLDGRPSKRLRLEPTNVELENAELLFVTVHAFLPAASPANDDHANRLRRYHLRARHPDDKPLTTSSGGRPHIEDVAPNEGDVRCKNCGQWVPQRTLMLHENFCLRNNVLCSKGCGQVFQKRSPEFERHWHCSFDSSYGNSNTSWEKHNATMHPPDVLRCQYCTTRETFASVSELAHHRTTTCPAKLVLCRFCHLVVPQEGDPDAPDAEVLLSGMTAHELADGARTTDCHLCSRIVRLRDMDVHMKGHELDRLSRPAPTPCRNVNCGRTLDSCAKNGDTRAGTRMGQGPGNDIGLCSVCFGPLYVSLYDPEGKALKRRIERRYLQQLTVGCGKSWCKNEFCKTGRTHLGIDGNVTTKDAVSLVRPFVSGMSTRATPFHFCVDEKSQRSRNLAELLAAGSGDLASNGFDPIVSTKGGYSFEWCVGALEAEGGDLQNARQWLRNWAPTRHDMSVN